MTTDELMEAAPRDAEGALVGALRAVLGGEVIDREHPGYDEARQVWNGLIDRFPAVIARCTGTADVVEAVRVARVHRPVVSVRGGGHQVAGSAVIDDGLVIDLSPMTGVHVDPARRTVRAQAGATSPRTCRTPSRRSSRCGAFRPTRPFPPSCTVRRSSSWPECTPARPTRPGRHWRR